MDRYSEIIFDEEYFSSDNLNAVINSAISDYENGESDGEDIEIYDNVEQRVIWTTSDSD